FEESMRGGAFGDMSQLPKGLSGAEIEFKFESPLHDAVEREKGQRFLEAKEMIAAAVEADPSTAYVVDANIALREVLDAIKTPASWIRTESQAGELMARDQQQQMLQAQLAQAEQGSKV